MSTTADILVVDDDEDIRLALQRLLTYKHYAVDLADSAEQALAALETKEYDLVLTDLQMPGMDGLDLIDQIKLRSPQTPVVMITAHAVAENVIQALRRGVSDFIPKPYRSDELLAIVGREAARRQSLRVQAASPTPQAAAPSAVGRLLTPAQLGEIDRILAELRAEAAARCTLLVEGSGHVIDAKGVIEDINISALAALVAGDFAATAGIASLIGEGESFRLNYHEGSRFSVYSAHLTSDAFLLVIFGQDVKSGMVLYVTRQALPQLQAILERSVSQAEQPAVAPGAAPSLPEPGAGITLGADEQLFSLDQILDSELLGDDALQSLADQFKQMWK